MSYQGDMKMNGGLFITLFDEKTLKLYLKHGIYGFLMNPVGIGKRPSWTHFAALSDYACAREGTHVFFFLKRSIVYGGTVVGNKDIASFYFNGKNSPIGREQNANLFWDESNRSIYEKTQNEGVFKVAGIGEKSQPYILKFKANEAITCKKIASDELYFELGNYNFPLPSNSIRGMSFCTLTPGETKSLLRIINDSHDKIDLSETEDFTANGDGLLFRSSFIDFSKFQAESELEFNILSDIANIKPLEEMNKTEKFSLCRQVPICPFKPENMDQADICLYSTVNPIKNGLIPNVIIELKKNKANFHAYDQVLRYLRWLQKITNNEDFEKIKAIIVAPSFTKNITKNSNGMFDAKIQLYSLDLQDFVEPTVTKV